MQISRKRLGMNVRAARERKGLSVEELAMEIKEPVEDVEKIESGTTRKDMSLDVAMSICFALDITPNELFDGIEVCDA